SYALSADLRPVAPAGAVRSASDTNMSQSENPNMAESPKDSGGASLEDALQAMESELQGLTEIVSAPGAVDKGLDQMVNGSPPQAPPAAEVFDEASDETDEADEVDHFNEVVDEVVDEVLLGEDAAPT